jgi:hypothetical protein
MTQGFYHIEPTGLAGLASPASDHSSGRPERVTVCHVRAAIGWLPVILVLGIGAWLLPLGFASKPAGSEPVHLATAAATRATPATIGQVKVSLFDPATAEAITAEQPAPVDGVKISSQSWRRGGLGSNAFVTLTLRNANDYAVRDIEISCAFARQDGSHLTDRTRLIRDTINMKGRKTFTRMHVGFVNINASKAKCSPLAASHI